MNSKHLRFAIEIIMEFFIFTISCLIQKYVLISEVVQYIALDLVLQKYYEYPV